MKLAEKKRAFSESHELEVSLFIDPTSPTLSPNILFEVVLDPDLFDSLSKLRLGENAIKIRATKLNAMKTKKTSESGRVF